MSEIGAPLVQLGRHPLRAGGRGAYSSVETVVLLIAGLAFMGGLINVGSALQAAGEPARYTVALVLLAAVQMSWALLLLWRPSRGALLLGGTFNLGIVALLLLSRTAAAPPPWAPGAANGLRALLWCAASLPGAHPGAGAGLASLFETVGQAAIIVAAFSVAASARSELARRVAAHISPLLAAVLFLSVLYGFGAPAG